MTKDLETKIAEEARTYCNQNADIAEWPRIYIAYQDGTKSPAMLEAVVNRAVELTKSGRLDKETNKIRYLTYEELLAIIMKEFIGEK